MFYCVMSKLTRQFYARDAIVLAPALIGTTIVHRVDGQELRARIVETEAYVGTHDLACHASKGRTKRTEIMFGPAGHAYVYLIYGMYEMFNIVASVEGDAQAVLIRAAEPIGGWDGNVAANALSGPGKFADAMRISRAENGIDLTGDTLCLMAERRRRAIRLMKSKRVGVDYAGRWAHEMLRFFDADSGAVSKPRSTGVEVIP
jgi:DNA-3-methyladenine glycosylase